MYLLTIYGCLFNIFAILILNRFIKIRFLKIVVLLSLFFSFLCSVLVFYEVVMLKSPCFIDIAVWIQSGFLNLKWTLIFDSLSVTMLCVVLFISFLVHLYSMDYMGEDPHIVRFIFSLSLFTFFMLLMITANNVLQLFLGWEGVGLSSYLLINFWFGRLEANKSAMKAIVVNRIGDFGLYLAILFLVFSFKTLNLGAIFALSSFYDSVFLDIFGFNVSVLTIIACFIFLGTMGKSAQIGLHMWLPDAMEGPTPVSALLHAATMVTAGVFLLLRFSIIVEKVPFLLIFITFIGFLTTFFAGISALFQYDIKKIIAYSTCSHLGIMLILCGFSHYDVALFHLFNHAFFKALLFLSAGVMIHSLNDEQDIRKMGALSFLMPFTYSMFLVGSLSLIGLPFLSGFFSKDRAWELFFSRFYDYSFYGVLLDFDRSVHFVHKYAFLLFTIIVILSVGYAFRLILFVFPFFYNGFRSNLSTLSEATLFMGLPLLILSFFSIFAGYVFKDIFVGLGSHAWNNSVPRSFFISDTFVSIFQELFFASVISWYGLVLKLFTFFLSMGFLFFLGYTFGYFSLENTKRYGRWTLAFCEKLRIHFLAFFLSVFVFFLAENKPFNNFVRGRVPFKSKQLFLLIPLFSYALFFFYSIILGFLFFLPVVRSEVFSFWTNSVYFYNRFSYKLVQSWLMSDHFLYRWTATFFSYVSYHVTFKSLDRGFVEFFGPFGVVQIVSNLTKKFNLFLSRPFFFSFIFFVVFCMFLFFVSLFWFSCLCFLKYLIFIVFGFFLLSDR